MSSLATTMSSLIPTTQSRHPTMSSLATTVSSLIPTT